MMKKGITPKEILFQVLVHGLIFVSLYFDRNEPIIQWEDVSFFLNYALAALIINYVLLPKFYYQKKYWLFALFLILVFVAVIVVEEMVIEKAFFPDTRGQTFQGTFFTLIDIVPAIFMIVGFKFGWDAFHKQQEVDALKSSAQESELQYLKSQINPHFLFNNLNNLYSYAIERSDKTPKIILELSSILRYMLYECREKFVPLEKEIKNLHDYVEINKLQIEDRGVVGLVVENRGVGYQIAPLILIVFVENAFKHSQSSMHQDIRIDIDLLVEEDGKMIFKCRNSFDESTNVDNLSKGIGLQNVKKRLELLYPQKHRLEIEVEPHCYIIYLEMLLDKTE